MAQMVVVVEILIAQRDAEHALAHERCNPMLDQISTAPIIKAVSKATNQIDGPVGGSQQQRSCIAGDCATIKSGHN
jgi:hypothetical protein